MWCSHQNFAFYTKEENDDNKTRGFLNRFSPCAWTDCFIVQKGVEVFSKIIFNERKAELKKWIFFRTERNNCNVYLHIFFLSLFTGKVTTVSVGDLLMFATGLAELPKEGNKGDKGRLGLCLPHRLRRGVVGTGAGEDTGLRLPSPAEVPHLSLNPQQLALRLFSHVDHYDRSRSYWLVSTGGPNLWSQQET